MNKIALTMTVLGVVALASVGVYFFTSKSVEKAEVTLSSNQISPVESTADLENKLSVHADLNPVENLPSANPFETEVNPFEDEVDFNPFK